MGIVCCCCCCFNNLYARTLEIIAIIFHSTQSIFLFFCLIAIKWSKIPGVNLALFIIMFIIVLINLAFIIMLRYWRAKGIIKTTKKNIGTNISVICFALIIICLIICVVENFVISYAFQSVNYPCLNYKYSNDQYYNDYYYQGNYYYYKIKNNNTENIRNLNTDSDIDKLCANKDKYYDTKIISDGEYTLSYSALCYLEVTLILGMWIYLLLRRRIFQGLDGPSIPSTGQVQGQRAVYDQYGRQVVVVQPGDVVVMDGQQHVAVPIGQYNQYNVPNYQINNNNSVNNLPQSQNFANQVNPGSQEYMQEKPN